MNMLARSSQSAKRCDVPLILIYFSSRLSRKREPTCVVRGHGGTWREGRGQAGRLMDPPATPASLPPLTAHAFGLWPRQFFFLPARPPPPEVAAIMENAFGDNCRVGLMVCPLYRVSHS